MEIDRRILLELRRFNEINNYINEQDAAPEDPAAPGAPPAPEGGAPAPEGGAPAPPEVGAPAPPEGGTAAPAEDAIPEPIDIENDPDIEEVKDEDSEGGEEETEEIDITDLIKTQEEMKTGQEEFMDNIFSKIDDLASKLQHMDQIMDKINSLENKFDKYREKTPEEKLMLRSLDSYPYNQKLTDFFDDKKVDMEKTGKNEYVLTSDEVEEFSPNEIKKTFNNYEEDEEKMVENYLRRKKRI